MRLQRRAWGDYSATQVDPDASGLILDDTGVCGISSSLWGTKISQVFPCRRELRPRAFLRQPRMERTRSAVTIPITVTFNDNVTVAGGIPSLALNAGGGATATYVSGSGGKLLTFNYTVASGQASGDLDFSSAAALSLNGATIRDANTASNLDAILTLAAPGTSGSLGANKDIVINTAPRVTGGVSATNSNATYGPGTVIHVTVTFSSAVTVAGGIPHLALNAGAGAIANYVTGSGTVTLTFDYTVAPGDSASDLDYTSTTALTLPAGVTIQDSSTSANAVLTLAAPGAAGSLGANRDIVIDTSIPSVSVSVQRSDGSYGFSTLIPITIT